MTNRPFFITVGIVLALVVGIFGGTHQETALSSVSAVMATTTTSQEVAAVASAPHAQTSRQAAITPSGPTATLETPYNSYIVGIEENETVLEMMNTLKASGTFVFTEHEYPSLGMFIDSINGEKNGNGKYWVYYVNGVDASRGVSTQTVHTGDVIEWRYENSY